jgi:hypothetical protein
MWGNAPSAILTPFSRNTLGAGTSRGFLGPIQELPGSLSGKDVGTGSWSSFQSGFVFWKLIFLP